MPEIASQIIVNILITAAMYLLVAVSFTIIYYPAKFFHIAQAAVISIAAYFAYFFNQQLHFSLAISIFLSVILSIILSIILELFIYRPLRKKNIAPLGLMIASIGLYVVLQNIISLTWGDDTLRLNTFQVVQGHNIFGALVTNVQIISFFVTLILFVFVITISKYTTFGKSLRAVSDNAELSNIYGINSNKVILFSFVLGSALAACAGILTAADTNMTPTFGFNLLLYGVVVMIIGGVGSYEGLVGGALLVSAAQHLAAFYIDTKWMEAMAYLILIVFLIWKPYGFSGNRLRKVEIN